MASWLRKLTCLYVLATFIASWTGCESADSNSVSKPAIPAVTETKKTNGSRNDIGNKAKRNEAATPDGNSWFVDVTAESGVDFRHRTGDSSEKPFPAANGSGIACLDIDLDGNQDLYFATGTEFPLDPSRPSPTNRVYQNLGGFHFRDITSQSGLGHNGYSAGLVVGDIDNDGFPDVYVICYGENRLYHNCGDGTFERIEVASGVNSDHWGTSGAFLDYDRDGVLDLYVVNYADWSLETNGWCGDRVRNLRFFCNPLSVTPTRDILFHGLGNGHYENVTDAMSVELTPGRGQGVIAADLNNDGWTDLYIANDLNPNCLLINDHGTGFRDVSEVCGAAYDARGSAQAGMGLDVGDVDRNGTMDIFVTNFANEYNTLYQNLGNELFQDVTGGSGLGAPSLPWIGWGTALADFDLDGWLDVVVTNGHTDDNRHLLGSDSPFRQPPLLFRNQKGRRFSLLENEAGGYFSDRHCGRGLVTGDFDNDGDQDLVIGHQDEKPNLLRNENISSARSTNFLGIRLAGTASNRNAIGATIQIRTPEPGLVQAIRGGGSYLSANELQQTFAVPANSGSLSVEVRWPNGSQSTIEGLEPNSHYLIIEPPSEDASAKVVRVDSTPVGSRSDH